MKKLMKIVFDSHINISGISNELFDTIKDELTMVNPQYQKVLKYSKYSYTKVPPYLMYYTQLGGSLRIPMGYSLPSFVFSFAQVIDNRVYEKIKTPDFVLELREDQKKAAMAYIHTNKDPYHLQGCIQMPTGKGKSILGLYLAHHYSTKTLIVVHKDDLVKGWKNDIALAFGGKVTPGIIKAKSRTVGNFITIATIQTLNKLKKEELDNLYSQFGFIIQDEMHHCPADSFSLVSNFPARYRLGLTATPERSDGLDKVMNLYFGNFVFVVESKEDDKDILPVQVIRKDILQSYLPKVFNGKYIPYKTPVPEKAVLINEVPYDERPRIPFYNLDNATFDMVLPVCVSDIYNEYCKGYSCVVFLSQKEHVRVLRDVLHDRGVPLTDIGLYYGDTSTKDNDRIREIAEEKRKFITLTTYSKTSEGTNVKQWEVAFLVSSINNGKNVEQVIGRVRRSKPGKKLSRVKVYDYRYPNVYSFSTHGSKRDARYRKLKCTFENEENNARFSRGFRN